MNLGYWPNNYWQAGYWSLDYWPIPGTSVVIPTVIRQFSTDGGARRKLPPVTLIVKSQHRTRQEPKKVQVMVRERHLRLKKIDPKWWKIETGVLDYNPNKPYQPFYQKFKQPPMMAFSPPLKKVSRAKMLARRYAAFLLDD